ncbi:MAG: hypothetical protein H7301_10230 [Cryobacterium sp.]|nr:hypothetical protein [Oligoflexia bacterium]
MRAKNFRRENVGFSAKLTLVWIFLALTILQARATPKDAILTLSPDQITIHSEIYIYGAEATNDVAKTYQESILAYWSKDYKGRDWKVTDPKTRRNYTVAFDVHVSVFNEKERATSFFIFDNLNPSSRKNYIRVSEVCRGRFRSHVSMYGDTGVWCAGGPPSVIAHEYGHLLGLIDRYHSVRDHNELDHGWESNLMADGMGGEVEQRNIDAALQETIRRLNPQEQ